MPLQYRYDISAAAIKDKSLLACSSNDPHCWTSGEGSVKAIEFSVPMAGTTQGEGGTERGKESVGTR